MFLSLCRLCVCVFLCSHWSLVDVPLIFFCPADHVPDWQPRVLLGMVEARSVNVKKTTTTTSSDRPKSVSLFLIVQQQAMTNNKYNSIKVCLRQRSQLAEDQTNKTKQEEQSNFVTNANTRSRIICQVATYFVATGTGGEGERVDGLRGR